MNTSIHIPLELESTRDETPAESSTRELLLGLLLGAGALVSVHLVWRIVLLALHWLGLLP
ncbi:hypothetical protein [Polaromonas sp. YR568]|uniref:hypothetical protein n=1 Tax=Polaromonas sp. YR568 TaxID=1855301 RepID=UPI001113C5B0|nr:hypothetical protein [Polaromonas sp. YR568]